MSGKKTYEGGARADGGGDRDAEDEEEYEEDLYSYARAELERIEAARKARKATTSAARYGHVILPLPPNNPITQIGP